MVIRTDTTAQKLVQAFMQFHKAEWHEHSIAGCTPSEIKVLFCVRKGMKHNNSIITVSEISKILRVTSPTITQLLKKLEANCFVERHADATDRRVVRITLTEKGQSVAQQAEAEFRASLDGLIDHLGEEQCNQLADLLSRVFHYYHEKAANEQYMDWNGDQNI
ncbi:MAG: MarR family transcriptional regulator [Ktedonobacteraceae bacterium]